MKDIPKTYEPKEIESKWYKYWEEQGLFTVSPESPKPPYCIMMPPPNITGELHMGHALQDTIQDLLIRLKRMQGYESHWQAGKDHAGIATQNVVERDLHKNKGLTRKDLSREEFLDAAWKWKEKFGNRIFEQKRLLGDSCDWQRERFTLDAGLSKAVMRAFVQLYQKGLIYRGNYIVNWCPRCLTAISDEEVDHYEHKSHLWYFKYPLKENSNEFIVVATTRPETMLGDTAIAVNPKDERFKHLVGEYVLLPLANRLIPVIADDFVDPSFGTGQVKVTPAHDPNDFQMGLRHNLEQIIVMDERGCISDNAPEQFRGLDRFEAREAVVKALEQLNLLAKIEEYTTSIGHCQRCNTIIEPYLSKQWFVKMKPLAEPAIEAVKRGDVQFYPSRWEKVYYSWMENIRDWCISRQLWWGHRIPVWYCKNCDNVMVSDERVTECSVCSCEDVYQDEDVLDTWFSSWLWPFSTLGWHEKTDELEFWYPTNVLVSGYDIIFFWIARMIIAGIEFSGDIPFRDVYITGMVRDEQGRWMSKSLGNGIDPREMVAQYGADAVRFTLVTLASEGQDIKLAPSRFEGGRNFANKLWNSFRFIKGNLDKFGITLPLDSKPKFEFLSLADRWIVSRFTARLESILENSDKYRLNDYAIAAYDFIWKEYCDWYLEFSKIRLNDPSISENEKKQTIHNMLAMFDSIMRMLHPIMPFISEEIYQTIYDKSIMYQPFPQVSEYPRDEEADNQMEFLQDCIGAIRNIRSEMRIPPDRQGIVIINRATDEQKNILKENDSAFCTLSGLSQVLFDAQRPPQSASATKGNVEIYIPLAGLIDIDKERERLNKEISRLQGIIKSAESKLKNDKFISNAPEQVIAHEKQKLSDCQMQLELVRKNVECL